MKKKRKLLYFTKNCDKMGAKKYFLQGEAKVHSSVGGVVCRVGFEGRVYWDEKSEPFTNAHQSDLKKNPDGDNRTSGKMEMTSLKEMNVDVLDAANYLIQLFYLTGKKYRCTTTKLGKLLSISAFIGAKNGVNLFNETIKAQTCGTTMCRVPNNFPYEIIVPECNRDREAVIDESEIDETLEIPESYNFPVEIDCKVKDLLKDVFLHYGKYPAERIGCLLDDFKSHVINSEAEEKIDLLLANKFFNGEVTNELHEYIKGYLW